MGAQAKAWKVSMVTGASAARNPAFGVMTSTPPAVTGSSGSGGAAKRRAYASLPRKYNPLTKLKTSPRWAPSGVLSCCANVNWAVGDATILARTPPQFAGDNRKIRGAAPATDTTQVSRLRLFASGEPPRYFCE